MLDRLGLATVGDGPFPYPFVDRHGALRKYIMPDCTINPLRVTPAIGPTIFQPPDHARWIRRLDIRERNVTRGIAAPRPAGVCLPKLKARSTS